MFEIEWAVSQAKQWNTPHRKSPPGLSHTIRPNRAPIQWNPKQASPTTVASGEPLKTAFRALYVIKY